MLKSVAGYASLDQLFPYILCPLTAEHGPNSVAEESNSVTGESASDVLCQLHHTNFTHGPTGK